LLKAYQKDTCICLEFSRRMQTVNDGLKLVKTEQRLENIDLFQNFRKYSSPCFNYIYVCSM